MKDRRERWFFLRGLVREAGHWSGFLEQFEKAFPHRRAIPLDLPGNGVRFRDPSPCSVRAMTLSVREEFLRHRGESNHLFALSLGAMVGLEWMHLFPADFQSAVLVNTSVRGLSPLFHRLRPSNYPRIVGMMLSGDAARVERGILAMTSNRTERHAELERSWLEIQARHPVSLRNAVRQLFAASRFHPPQEKPAVPVRILNGGGDRLVHPRCSEVLARHWDLEAKVHPSAGHDLTLDEPGWVIEQVRDFPG